MSAQFVVASRSPWLLPCCEPSICHDDQSLFRWKPTGEDDGSRESSTAGLDRLRPLLGRHRAASDFAPR